jgi:hypothetical protein
MPETYDPRGSAAAALTVAVIRGIRSDSTADRTSAVPGIPDSWIQTAEGQHA